MDLWRWCLLAFIAVSYASADCPASLGWTQPAGSTYCYNLVTYTSTPKGNNTWAEANQLCIGRNAALVSISSYGELQTVQQLMMSRGVQQAWIGLSDRVTEGTYAWSDGTSVTYRNWGSGEPNNVADEDCVQMDSRGYWNDVACSIAQSYICKKVSSASTPSPTAPKNYSLVNTTECGGWYEYSGHCYNYYSSSRTWSQATSACFAQGATLLIVLTADEIGFIKSFIHQKRTSSFFLALNDQVNEGQFVWDDGTAAGVPLGGVTAWGSGEPNDNRHSEDCVEWLPQTLLWNDIQCYARRRYMCKRQANSTGKFPPIKRQTRHNCPGGWQKYNHPNGAVYCYRLYGKSYGQRTTWYGARTACRRSGSGFDLVSIHDHLEMAYVSNMIARLKFTAYSFWLGLNDVSQEGGYVWSDGTATNYIAWNTNQPNNLGGRQDCTELYRYNGKWNDNRCTYRQAYICKYTLTQQPNKGGTPNITDRYCKTGWIQFGSYCYFLVGNTQVNHSQAVMNCKKMNSNLTSINSPSEQAFLMANLGAHNASVRVHIGINDLKREGEFTWTDGSIVTFTNWGYQQPNDWRGKQDCTELSHTLGYWNDIGCAANRGYICKSLRDQLTQPPSQVSKCLPGFAHYKKYCYKVYPTKVSFDDAQVGCTGIFNSHSLMGGLATIRSRYDNFFLTSLVSVPMFPPTATFWIGLNDKATEGVYQWINKDPITYTNWYRGQPNDWHHQQDCVVFWRSDGQWNDDTCSKLRRFICMVPDQDTMSLPPPPTPPSGSTTAKCPQYWTTLGTYCYGFFGSINSFTMGLSALPTSPQPLIKPLNWADAAATCKQMGANLVSIHNNDTQNHLFTSMSLLQTGWTRFWSGLNDRNEEGGYVWEDGTPIAFTAWSTNQPNDWRGAQDCVEVITTGRYAYTWNDNSCAAQRPYICEVPAGKAITLPTSAPQQLPQGMKVTVCQPGWIASQTMCYKIMELGKGRSFTSAELTCHTAIGPAFPNLPTPHLASIHSAQEHIFLAGFLLTFLNQNNWNNTVRFWIGLNDRDTEGNYTWKDNTTVDYFGWYQGQPNNWRGQDCVEMRTDFGYLWNDVTCASTIPYVCGYSRLISTTAPPPTIPSVINQLHCGPGWRKMGASCYKEFHARLNWENAFINCSLQKGDLLVINSKQEQYFVTSEIIEGSEYVWIGLNDKDRERYWRWVDGNSVSYKRWGPYQPNNYKNQDCAAIHGSDGMWYDRDCDEPHAFVCEVPVIQVNYTGGNMPTANVFPGPSGAPQKRHGKGGLGTGGIVGIAMGVILLVVVVVAVVVWRKRSGRSRNFNRWGTVNTAADDDDDSLLSEE